MIESVFDTGEATWSEDLLLVLNRSLPREEGYFTFSYSPIWDDFANVAGIFCVCYETTGRVIGERRLRTLRDLGRTVMQARTEKEACELTADTLSRNRADIPFTLLYLTDDKGASAHLVATVGVDGDSEAAPVRIDLTAPLENTAWPLRHVIDTGSAELVTDLESRFGPLPGGPWPESSESAFVLPIGSACQARPVGFLIAGLSPRRIIDSDYRSFLDLIAGHLATAIANARASEEDRRRAEALAELDRAKTQFFSNVSHEFRTPLTLMLGPLENVLATENLSVPASEQLTAAHQSSLRLLKLVNSLLDFSRIEAGRVKASYAPVDLASFTADLASHFRSAMESGGLELHVDCPPLPQPVYVDREMWEKIVLNLLSNAFKFTLNGKVTVRLECNDSEAALSVSDTGVGIQEAELPHIFERFHRIEGAMGRTYEGTGIGLALVQELIHLHGGTVTVASVIGKGTTFTVRIPLGKEHLPPDRVRLVGAEPLSASRVEGYVEEAWGWLAGVHDEKPAPAAIAQIGERNARVLLADDNADMRDYVRRLLNGYVHVNAVSNGQEALSSALSDPPDLILSDVMMPVLDGFALLRELRAHPETSTIPVILLSARAGEESRVEGISAGADDYLVKPFSAQELIARVATHVNMARQRQAAMENLRQRETELRRANEDLTQFAYSATHDLKEPLRNVSIYSQLLLRKLGATADTETQQYLNSLLHEAERMAMLLRDLLTYTQVATDASLSPWSDAGVALKKAVEDLQQAIAESHAEIIADSLPALAVAEVHLHQLLQNLIGNAIKYRDPVKPPRVRVAAIRQDSYWRFVVEDNGIGIAPEYHKRIFGLFKRLHSPSRYSGTGIGLALVKRIVELYGGQVWVESEPGNGAAFFFTLPAGDQK
ncbi:MAG TPA: ATP-binding protein [Bryobacteraceae bacterium]